MANLNVSVFYTDSAQWTAITAWPTSTPVSCGTITRQNSTPTVGNERAFVCGLAGTTSSSEPAWTITRYGATSDGSTDAVTSGTYSSITGLVTLIFTTNPSLVTGDQFTVTGITGTGSVASCNGTFTAGAGTSGTTVTYTIATGLTLTITPGTGSLSVPIWYECTGNPATNGDLTNALTWTQQHSSSTTVTTGLIIYDATSASLQLITTGGTIGASSPAFSATAGTVTTDNTAKWTSLGAASNFQYWKAPHDRLANMLASTWGAAGDTYYVGDDHAETQSSAMTLTFSATVASPNSVYCVDHTANAPPTGSNLKTTATITTTGTSSNNITGYAYVYGIGFFVASGAVNAAANIGNSSKSSLTFEACSFSIVCTGGGLGAGILFAGAGNAGGDGSFLFKNTTVTFGNTGQGIRVANGFFTWKNTNSAIGGTPPSAVIAATNGAQGTAVLDGIDLSALGAGATVVAGQGGVHTQILNCKLGASVTVGATPSSYGGRTDLVISDSGATGYRQESYQFAGTLTTSTAVYNNASDGVTPISWQIVTTTNASRAFPFECFQIVQWVAAGTFANTAIQVTSATASLTNANIWVEAEYLGTSGFPISSLASSAPANLLTAGSALAAGTWATGSAGNNYKLAVPSFTTAIAGYVRFTVKVALASLTVYVDPAVTVA